MSVDGSDILRGVRLAAVTFAGILLVVAVYRMFHTGPEVPGERPSASAATQPEQATGAQTAPPATPSVKSSSESASVPPPPPPGEKNASRRAVAHAAASRVVRVNSANLADPGEAQVSQPVSEPSSASDPAVELPSAVGYKSLTEVTPKVNANLPAQQAEEDNPVKPEKHKIIKAVGRFLHIGGDKKTVQSLQPQQQP